MFAAWMCPCGPGCLFCFVFFLLFVLPVRPDSSSGAQANCAFDRWRIDLGRRVFVTSGLRSSIFPEPRGCVRVDRQCVEYHFQSLFTDIFLNYYYFPDAVCSKGKDTARGETKSLVKTVLWSTLDFFFFLFLNYSPGFDSVNPRWEEQQPCWSRNKEFLITLDRTSRRSPPICKLDPSLGTE